MLESKDTPRGSLGFSCNHNLETTTTELSSTRTKDNAFRVTIKRTESHMQKPCWIPVIDSIMQIAELEHLMSIQKPRCKEYDTKETEKLRTYYKIQECPREISRAAGSNPYLWKTEWIEKLDNNSDYEHNIKLIRSNPYTGKNNLRPTRIGYQPESPQNKIDELDKNLPTYLQTKTNPYLLFRTIRAQRKSQYLVLVSGSSAVNQVCPTKTYLVTDYMSAYLSKLGNNTYVKNISPKVSVPQTEYAEYILRSTKNVKPSILQENKYKETQHCYLNTRSTYSSIRITLGPNLNQQCVQTKKDEALYITDYYLDSSNRQNVTQKAVLNQLSRKSNSCSCELLATSYQRTGVHGRQEYNINQSSLLNLKRFFGPYAQIQTVYNVREKGTSQQFKQRSQGIGSGSVSGGGTGDNSSTSSKRRTIKIESGCSFSVEFIDRGKKSESQGSSSVPETETKQKSSKGKKKSLHRCLCTTSFPTDDKKLKNRPCDSGVCVPGACSASECFKRLQQKYGSKKKKSDSDVSSSQASQTKKKGKDGKKILKETGSHSISTYKESVQEKVIPPKKPAEPCMKKCCRMLQFWKKDKRIDLKPAVIGTDISVKGEAKEFGSNAATQSVEKGITKKGKKAKKKDEGKTVKKDTKKKKKGKTEPEKNVKGETVEKDTKKKKKGKTEPKKDGKEVKTETRGTGREMKKKRALKPYECEPGVCSPKVCSPKECYERKFPPPPPPEKATSFTKIKKCLLKVCCKRPPAEEKVAATQSPRSGPEKTPGMTVYQEKGTSGPRTGKIRVQKGETPGVTSQAAAGPVAGGDVPQDKQFKKQSPYSGIKYFQSVDNERNTTRQGVNIGSDCECSVEFYKMLY